MPRSATWARARLSPMQRTAVWSRSTNTARAEPRDRASIPPPPEPANRSRNLAPGKCGSRIANRVSLTRSPIGRVPSPGASSRVPRALPAITRPASLIDARLRRGLGSGGLGEDLSGANPGQPTIAKFGRKGLTTGAQRAVLVKESLGNRSGLDGALAIALVAQ